MATADRLNEARFDAMLRLAVIESFEEQMAAIPSDEALRKLYTFSERHERRMERLFALTRRRSVYAALRKFSYRAAAAFLIAVSLFFAALLANSDVRAAVGKTIAEWFRTFTRFSFTSDSVVDMGVDWCPTYLPKGFVESDVFAGRVLCKVTYTDKNGAVISFQYSMASDTSIAIDNEHGLYKAVVRDGVEYWVHAASGDVPASIVWEFDGVAFLLTADIDMDELSNVAYSVEER